MVRLCRWFLILLTLSGGGASVFAASSAENRAFNTASKAFQLGAWEYAETKYGEFVDKYPKSARVPEVVLLQAQARYNLDRHADAIKLLSANLDKAGGLQDEYLYLMAQAHFQGADYPAAAGLFARLIKEYPDSPRRVAASVAEATAFARLHDWSRVTELLQATNMVFRQAAILAPTNEWVIRGHLLCGEAQLAQKKFNEVENALEFLDKPALDSELSWRREYLRGRLQLARGQPEAALQSASNLLALAAVPAQTLGQTNSGRSPADVLEPVAGLPPDLLLAEARSFQAEVLQQLNRFDEAIAVYETNLSTNTPVAQQRHALLKIAELNLAQNQATNAVQSLEQYLSHHPRSGAADMSVLATGELLLRQYAASVGTNGLEEPLAASGPSTNLLQEALARFEFLLTTFTNSPLVGKALLDKGWCLWLGGDVAGSGHAFRSAAEWLPLSEDQAVARFKWADARFRLNDVAGAITNYDFIVSNYSSRPEIRPELVEQALYQIVRVALTNNMPAASNAMRKILDQYPNGFAGPHCLLLVGQGLTHEGDPAGARALFGEFEARFPANPLLPLVRLAVARTYECERNWDAAVAQYSAWIASFPDHRELPSAEFSRALDCFKGGRETNALMLLTNFVARFPTNELARQAQWWIGGYYFSQPDFQNAEKNYQLVYNQFTNLPPAELTYQAQMMAGRAAMARFSYSDAIRDYFIPLAGNTNCLPTLRDQALFAWGDALVSRDSTNKLADFRDAIEVFSQIPPTNLVAASALGRIGDCRLQLAALAVSNTAYYAEASNAYRQVIASPSASMSARSQARVGLGRVAEGLAALKTGEEQTALLKLALASYLDAFLYENSLRDGEQPDPFWVKESGLKAARLAERLQQWTEAVNIYQQLEEWYPPLHSLLEKRIIRARESVSQKPSPTGELTADPAAAKLNSGTGVEH